MDTPSAIQLFVSNRYERLYTHLRNQLFNLSSYGTNSPLSPCAAAFTQRLIITPTPALYHFIMKQLAADPLCKIAMGLERLAKESLLVKCGQWFAPRDHNTSVRPFPHYLELVFSLEKALKELLAHSEDTAFCALFSDLSPHTMDTQRRLRLLSESVATLFLDYSRYGADLFETWENSIHPHAKWQKTLWDALFGPTGSWHVAYQLPHLLDFSQCLAPKQMQLHLFCHTDLSLLEQTLLQALSLHLPVYIYQLSPTRMFWEDLLSPRAQLRLRESWEKRNIALGELKQATELLQEPSPLLSRLGAALHLREHQLSERVLERHEDYAIPRSLFNLPDYATCCDNSIAIEEETPAKIPTLLQALQGDLLLLRKPSSAEPILFSPQDLSIQLHAAPTPMREVEVMYTAILQLLHHHPTLESGQITLYAVDLPRYLPFLRACFEQENSPFKIEYLELPLHLQSPLTQSFLQLVHLTKGRFSARDLLSLLDNPHIQTAADINAQELKRLRRYIQQAPIYWGETQQAREAFLQKSNCHTPLVERDGVGTWQQGMTQLFIDLVMGTRDQEHPAIPFSEAPLIEKWLLWLNRLQADIQQLKRTEEHTLSEWSEQLVSLAACYIAPLDSHQEWELLLERLSVLSSFSAHAQLSQATFAFSSILPRLDWLFQQPKCASHMVEESMASVAPLAVHHLVPARIIGLLGLEEGAFPRKRRESPLDLLRGNLSSEYRPKTSDQERALVLQALLSAQEALLISYCSTNPHDGKSQGVAEPIAQLVEELNCGYRIDSKPAGTFITRHHPMHGYDPRYFHADSLLSNPIKRDYKLALLYGKTREPDPPSTRKEAIHPVKNWSLRHLQLAAQDPCALYLKEQLGITLLDPTRHCIYEEEPFEVAVKARYRLQDRALEGCVDSVLQRAKTRGELPYGLFGALTSQQIRSEVHNTQARLKDYQLENAPWTLTLHPTCLLPTYDQTVGWQLPAYTLHHSQHGPIMITGTLEEISPKGLLAYGTGDLEERAASWPLYLTFLLLRPQLETLLQNTIEPTLLFLGKKQHFTSSLTSRESLETALMHFMHYAEKTRHHCAPIHKDWLAPMLQGDLTRATLMMETALAETRNASRYRHILWALKTSRNKNLHASLEEWLPFVQNAYAGALAEKA